MTTADDVPGEAGEAAGLSAPLRPVLNTTAGPPRHAPPARTSRLWVTARQWPLLLVLALQAALSGRLLGANTAFMDEALYLQAGREAWAHLLHGAAIEDFPAYFSGAPVVYPPVAALAADTGGLLAARLLSLAFMLAATAALWITARRLFGQHAAFFAATLWVILAPTQRLGAFATYDAMALCLMAFAACCATAVRVRRGARWLLAAACLLVLANVTKYATMLFDPVIGGLAFLTGLPAGWRTGARRLAVLLAATAAGLGGLAWLAGGEYLSGVWRTTLDRPTGGTPAGAILGSAWQWTGVLLVLAMVGLGIGLRAEPVVTRWLLALLAGAALLAPVEQARIHTLVSLSKHVDFGAWFAAITAGYAIGWLLGRLTVPAVRLVLATLGCLLLVPYVLTAAAQARSFFSAWPSTTAIVGVLRKYTTADGRFFADNVRPLQYDLPHTAWRQWISIYSLTAGARPVTVAGVVRRYRSLLAPGDVRLVVLSFTVQPRIDRALAIYMASDRHYRMVADLPWHASGNAAGRYLVWLRRAGRVRGGAGHQGGGTTPRAHVRDVSTTNLSRI